MSSTVPENKNKKYINLQKNKLTTKSDFLTPETNGIFQTDNAGKLMIEDHVAGR